MASAPTKTPPVDTLPSAEQRAAAGKAAREAAPRASHGEWEPAARRRDPVKVLEDQAKSRVPELVPIRYGRMLVSPFTFYRGAAAIMAMDLAKTPDSGLRVQACGDAHLSNFGVFAAPDRRLVMDVNDFDETLPGPWEWDVKRLAASFEIAGRDRDFTPKETRAAVLSAVRHYREAMREFAAMRNLDVWYARLDVDTLIADLAKVADKKQMKAVHKNVKKAGKKNSLKAFDRLVHEVDGEPRIISDPPLLVPAGELVSEDQREALEERILEMLGRYRESLKGDRRHLFDSYRFVEMARKVVGVGSVGTRAWVLLMMGRDGQDPLFLQAKEAEASVLEPYVGRERVRKPRRAGGRGPVADAGRERHPPGLAAGARDSTAASGTSTCASSGTGSDRSRSRPCRRRGWRSTGGSAAGPWPAPMRDPATGSRSAPTSARARASIRRSPTSRSATPTRTSSTTAPSPTRPSRVGSRWRRTSFEPGCEVASRQRAFVERTNRPKEDVCVVQEESYSRQRCC